MKVRSPHHERNAMHACGMTGAELEDRGRMDGLKVRDDLLVGVGCWCW